jgi:hypothetical protein
MREHEKKRLRIGCAVEVGVERKDQPENAGEESGRIEMEGTKSFRFHPRAVANTNRPLFWLFY